MPFFLCENFVEKSGRKLWTERIVCVILSMRLKLFIFSDKECILPFGKNACSFLHSLSQKLFESHQQGMRFSCAAFDCAFFYCRKDGKKMDKELYFQIFNKITDLIEELETLQCEMEELYISQTE